MSTCRNEPNNSTCPKIDQAIQILEDLRHENAQLCEWGNGLVKNLEQQDKLINKLRIEL